MNKGGYLLLIRIIESARINIGALGKIDFPPGLYAYSGSAMRNLRQRVDRHFSAEKKIRWHIDYLLDSDFAELQKAYLFHSENRVECEIVKILINYKLADYFSKGIGSSDCKICKSHLMKLNDKFNVEFLTRQLRIEPCDVSEINEQKEKSFQS